MDRIVFMTIIVQRKQKEQILSALSEVDVHLTSTIYGRGAANAGLVKFMLGLVPDDNKAVITFVLTNRVAQIVFDMLTEKFHFDRPNTGMAFTTPIDRLSF